MDRLFYNLKDFAAKMSVSEKTIYRMLTDDQIPFAVKIGGQWRFRIDAVDSWISAQSGGLPESGRIDTAITISTALSRGSVLYRIHGDNRDEALDELLATLPYGVGFDITGLKVSILARESLAPSSLKGIACMMPAPDRPIFMDKSIIILAFLEKPTDFKALDHEKSFAFFLILAANTMEQSILETRLRRLLMEPELIDSLKEQRPRQEIIQLISETESGFLPPARKPSGKSTDTL